VRERLRAQGIHNVSVREAWGAGCQYYRHGHPHVRRRDAAPSPRGVGRARRRVARALRSSRPSCSRTSKRGRAPRMVGGVKCESKTTTP
jgi:hypothetical protein